LTVWEEIQELHQLDLDQFLLDVRYFCCRQRTLNLRRYLPMFGAVYHLKLSEE